MIVSELPRKREARKADRRRTILDVAERSFLERGYAETSMSTIAAELGGSKTTLWSYFPSKEALFAAVLDAKIDAFRAALDDALIPAGGTEAALSRFGRVLLRKVTNRDSTRLHRLVVSEVDRFPALGRAFAERGPERVRARLCRYLEEEMAAGRLRHGDAMIAARQFISLCQAGCYFDRLLRPELIEQFDIDGEVAASVATFMAAWGPRG